MSKTTLQKRAATEAADEIIDAINEYIFSVEPQTPISVHDGYRDSIAGMLLVFYEELKNLDD